MRKASLYPFLIPLLVLLVILNLPRGQTAALKETTISFLAGFWSLFQKAEEPGKVYSENKVPLLEMEIANLKATVLQELQLLEKLADLQNIEGAQKHRETILRNIEKQIQAIPATIIYRSPATWSSSAWIDKGEADAMMKNSPVLAKGSLIGVVYYVGKQQSRVRLITDSGLSISVRAARGASIKERNPLPSALLAKGELSGSSMPLWRAPGQLLKGIGFNYDFGDEEGPARDLRTGVPEGSLSSLPSEPLIKIKDLLVTTGYDGIFPAGIPVAEVVRISPLDEGDYYYSLEASPSAGSLDELSHVLVLPPQGYDKTDQPPAMVW